MKNKVLVVDDEQSIVTLLQYNLEQAGFEVITAMDGEREKEEPKPSHLILSYWTSCYLNWMEWKYASSFVKRVS